MIRHSLTQRCEASLGAAPNTVADPGATGLVPTGIVQVMADSATQWCTIELSMTETNLTRLLHIAQSGGSP